MSWVVIEVGVICLLSNCLLDRKKAGEEVDTYEKLKSSVSDLGTAIGGIMGLFAPMLDSATAVARLFSKSISEFKDIIHGDMKQARDDAKSILDLIECGSQRRTENAPFHRQPRAIARPLEKWRTDMGLEMADMSADGAVRHREFLRGSGEPAMTRRRFKRAQCRNGEVFSLLHVTESHIG